MDPDRRYNFFFIPPAHLCRHIYNWNIVACDVKHQYVHSHIHFDENWKTPPPIRSTIETFLLSISRRIWIRRYDEKLSLCDSDAVYNIRPCTDFTSLTHVEQKNNHFEFPQPHWLSKRVTKERRHTMNACSFCAFLRKVNFVKYNKIQATCSFYYLNRLIIIKSFYFSKI